VLILPTTAFLSDHRGNVYQNAVNPEEKLLKEDIKKSSDIAVQKGDAVVDLIGSAGNLVVALSGGQVNNNTNNTFNYINIENSDLSVVQPSFWSDEALRKTDLYPNHKIDGQILFERMDKVPDFHLNLVVNETTFVVKYNQVLH